MQEGALTLAFGGESDDEMYESDDEGYYYTESDDERFSEFRPRWVRGRPVIPPPRNYGQGLKGTSGGRIITQGGGTAQIQFNKNVVTKDELEKRLELIRGDIKRVQDATTASIADLNSKFTANLRRMRRGTEQSSMFPLLLTMMQPKPELDKLKFNPVDPTKATDPLIPNTEYSVSSTAYKPQKDNTFLLLMVMMMGGMGGGFTGSSDSKDKDGGGGGDMQQLMMMLLLTQAIR